jgi:hypothetical protein
MACAEPNLRSYQGQPLEQHRTENSQIVIFREPWELERSAHTGMPNLEWPFAFALMDGAGSRNRPPRSLVRSFAGLRFDDVCADSTRCFAFDCFATKRLSWNRPRLSAALSLASMKCARFRVRFGLVWVMLSRLIAGLLLNASRCFRDRGRVSCICLANRPRRLAPAPACVDRSRGDGGTSLRIPDERCAYDQVL